jgi:hypothetical protein
VIGISTYNLTICAGFSYDAVRAALEATSAYRDVQIVPLSGVIGEFATVRQDAYRAFRRKLGPDGEHLPTDLGEIVLAITAFVDLRWVPSRVAGSRRACPVMDRAEDCVCAFIPKRDRPAALG